MKVEYLQGAPTWVQPLTLTKLHTRYYRHNMGAGLYAHYNRCCSPSCTSTSVVWAAFFSRGARVNWLMKWNELKFSCSFWQMGWSLYWLLNTEMSSLLKSFQSKKLLRSEERFLHRFWKGFQYIHQPVEKGMENMQMNSANRKKEPISWYSSSFWKLKINSKARWVHCLRI